MRNRIIISYLAGLIAILLTLTACINEATVTTTSFTTYTHTVTEPAETFTITVASTSSSNEQLTVHFIDVGQGDSILLDLGEVEVLIDGGDRSPGVVPYLNNFIDGALEVMVATHPHADHIGSLIEVLKNFEVAEIWHNGEYNTSVTYSDFIIAVNTEGAVVHDNTKRGDVITAGELSFNVLNPLTLDGSTNNNSIVLSLSYGDIDFLFMGDAEQEAEADMLLSSIVPVPENVEILKVGHHGSRTASSELFLEYVDPETAIYMAGEGNSYYHPHAETIQALNNLNVDIYGTDKFGNIVVITDGITYKIETEKVWPDITVG